MRNRHDVRRYRALLGAALLLALAAGIPGCMGKSHPTSTTTSPPPGGTLALGLQRVQDGLSFPLYLTSPPADTARLFVVEKGGPIRVIKNGALLATPFLDLTGQVSTGAEQGLLGMAFDPQYASNGRFYVSYTDPAGNSRIVRYLVSSDPDVAQPAADRILLTVTQPAANHNGGMITFGPDGMLYVGFGDGGGGGDTYGNGQDATDLLGSLLRLDVRGGGGYAIPADNPFSAPDAPELWDIGLRNPWRFSFDRLNGDLYIADVGQDAHEEIDVSPAAAGGGRGLNYGWPITEGSACFNPPRGCSRTGLTAPALDYGHAEGCSVTGGYVYRGSGIPALQGTYFYADYCQGWVRSFRWNGLTVTDQADWPSLRPGGNITSFGEDARGELYVLDARGTVDRIVAR
jgi:glucose/arabinose dehydrogenase